MSGLRLGRADVPPLYVIADGAFFPSEAALCDAVEAMARAGARWIQIRLKASSDAAVASAVRRSARSVSARPVSLWVNDRVQVAAATPCHGVHLGQSDRSPSSARRLLGETRWIGRSTHDRAQVASAADDVDVDAIAVGPVFPTSSKEDAEPVVGLELLRWARQRTEKPLLAIGGIDARRAAAVLAAGADAAVVLSAVCRGDVAANVRALLDTLGVDREERRR